MINSNTRTLRVARRLGWVRATCESSIRGLCGLAVTAFLHGLGRTHAFRMLEHASTQRVACTYASPSLRSWLEPLWALRTRGTRVSSRTVLERSFRQGNANPNITARARRIFAGLGIQALEGMGFAIIAMAFFSTHLQMLHRKWKVRSDFE